MPPHDKIPRKLKYSNKVEYMDIKISFSWLKLILIITLFIRDDYFLFVLVFIKKITRPIFLKKNLNRTETGSNRPGLVRVQVGFLG